MPQIIQGRAWLSIETWWLGGAHIFGNIQMIFRYIYINTYILHIHTGIYPIKHKPALPKATSVPRWAVNHIAHQMCSRLSGNKDRTMTTMAYTKMNIYEHVRFTLKIRLNTYEKSILTYINYTILYIFKYWKYLKFPTKNGDTNGVFSRALRPGGLLHFCVDDAHITSRSWRGKGLRPCPHPSCMYGWMGGCMHLGKL